MSLRWQCLGPVCLVLFFAGFTATAFSQSESASLSGLITDPQGRAVPGVDVEVTNQDTNISVHRTTNIAGVYVAVALKPGRYRVSVSKEGFRKIDLTDLLLNVQDVLSRNFQLQLGPVSTSITVVADEVKINTENASVSTVIDRNFVESLPLNGRSFNPLLLLTPGVVVTSSNVAAPGQFSINGQRTNANYFQVDGVSVNFGVQPGGVQNQGGGGGVQAFNAYGGTSSLVSVDALQEFRVETSSFSPEFGRTPGGQVIITTRSGTNEFHGSLFDYFRNDVLDANNWFANQVGLPRAPERQNDFGGVFGGPIVRDRTFFFFSYEGLRLDQPQTSLSQVPTVSARTSAVGAAHAILNAYPLPDDLNAPGFSAPFTGNFSDRITMDAASLRVDHTLTGRFSVFGRYSYSPSHLISHIENFSTVQTTPTNTKTLTVGANAQLSSSLADFLRFNYSTQEASSTDQGDSTGGAIPLAPTVFFPAAFPPSGNAAVYRDAIDSGGLILGTQSKNKQSQINVVDDLWLAKGSHQLKFGIDFRRLVLRQSGGALINYFVSQFSNFLADGMANVVIAPDARPAKILLDSFSSYAEDSWKLGQRLTLTYGLRWEINRSPKGLDATRLASWLNTNNPSATALAPTGTAPWRTTYGNVAPRVGLAYQLTPKGDFVVRGGWGIFYDLGTGTAPALAAAFPNSVFAFLPPSGGPYPFPINAASITPTFSLNPPFAGIISGFDPHLKLPYSEQWNVAVEKSLANKQSLSVTYVGQIGRRLLRLEDEAQPNANFSSDFGLTRNGDTSNYQALQTQFRRQATHGLEALLQYTWSHSIDNNSADAFFVTPAGVINPGNDRGSSDFDVRHNFSGAFSYEIPGPKKNAFLSGLAGGWSLEGIALARSGFPIIISTFNSLPGVGANASTRPDLVPGQPIWLSGAQCAATFQSSGALLPGQSCPGGKGLNPAAFVTPSTPRQGTLGRNSISGFGATQFDLSVGRTFPMLERTKLQFRADLFNVLNHPNFADPSGSLGAGFGLSSSTLNVGLGGLNSLYQIGGPRSIQLSLKLLF